MRFEGIFKRNVHKSAFGIALFPLFFLGCKPPSLTTSQNSSAEDYSNFSGHVDVTSPDGASLRLSSDVLDPVSDSSQNSQDPSANPSAGAQKGGNVICVLPAKVSFNVNFGSFQNGFIWIVAKDTLTDINGQPCPSSRGFLSAMEISTSGPGAVEQKAPNDDAPIVESVIKQTQSNVQTFSSKLTLYTTQRNKMEGGPNDRVGKPLRTLKAFVAGKVPFVSVAMDPKAFPYGTLLRIPEIEKRLGVSPIPFKVVDTGGDFFHKGRTRMDVCVGPTQADVSSNQFGWISQQTFTVQIMK